MRVDNSSRAGFSLLEVLLASIIFIISIGGIFVTLNALRRPVQDKESALAATIFGKQMLENLRSKVDAGTFYNTPCTAKAPCTDLSLTLGPHQVSGLTWPQGSSGPLYVANGGVLTYTVCCGDPSFACPDGSGNYSCPADAARKVNMTIQWTPAS